ncbi:glycosyltransferase family 4 protein [Clostridium perfringens]|uniref:glycosyltransferase family 4 protein n=1 Tax=Clostridium perfringens TaxID=1502 RepID=UPI0018AC415F|nr:glycosyltransferase family 4 protein [Clostridium perfringens]MDB2068700.1 glycosyltransferase family 4 protein [Clostridium perfringens]
MKILICIPTLQPAGAERFVTELAIYISLLGENVTVVTTNKLDETEFYLKLKNNNIKVRDVSGSNYFIEFIKIFKLLKEIQPDIVHSNIGSMLHMLFPTILYGKAIHIFTVHSMGYRIFSGIKSKIAKYVFSKNIVKPVAICDKVRESIYDTYKLKNGSVFCIYNGVDTKKFTRQPILGKNKISFISTGTLYNIKNHKMIIDAFKKVKNKYENVDLTIVGDGELRHDLEMQVAKNGLKESVIFVGRQGQVEKFLNEADVYLCSSIVEGLPLAVMEAMSMELPIITTPAGGVVDIVKNNVNGFIIEHDDVNNMANAMIKLILDDKLREEMGRKSREIVSKHDIRICAEEYMKLYKRFKK